jgi:spermidine synthase
MKTASAPVLPEASISEFEGVRYLHLGTPWVQGAMRLADPQRVELEYVRRMLAALLWLPTESLGQGRAVQLGLGAGTITRFTAQALKMDTTAVEINPQVVAACHHGFRLPRDGAGLRVVIGDAGDWVRDPGHRASVRLLHVDLYDAQAAAPVLDDEGFYAACHGVLDDGGVMAVNLFGRDASFERSSARIAAAFGAAQVWSLQPTREGNTVVVAARGAALLERDELSPRAAALRERHAAQGLDPARWVRMIRRPEWPSQGSSAAAAAASGDSLGLADSRNL